MDLKSVYLIFFLVFDLIRNINLIGKIALKTDFLFFLP